VKPLALAALLSIGTLVAQERPKVGDTAPDFTLPATMIKTAKLSDFRGKKVVVLAFFPAAFTGG
jgi:peroxiredoxin